MTSRAIYPDLGKLEPTAPPLPDNTLSPDKGTVRPRSESPFVRNLRARVEEQDRDMEAISCLLDFALRETPTRRVVTRGGNTTPEMVTVKTFATVPRTPDCARRPDRPPRIVSRGHLPRNLPRPRAVLPSTLSTRRPPSAALGAPPSPAKEEIEEGELPDLPTPIIPETPQSPPFSDITVMRLVLLLIYWYLRLSYDFFY